MWTLPLDEIPRKIVLSSLFVDIYKKKPCIFFILIVMNEFDMCLCAHSHGAHPEALCDDVQCNLFHSVATWDVLSRTDVNPVFVAWRKISGTAVCSSAEPHTDFLDSLTVVSRRLALPESYPGDGKSGTRSECRMLF